MKHFTRWLRVLIAICIVWTAGVAAIAGYEHTTIDPWRFIGESKGPIFFSWSTDLVYDQSPFGDFTLVFEARRFWAVLLVPMILLFSLVAMLPSLLRIIRRVFETFDSHRAVCTRKR